MKYTIYCTMISVNKPLLEEFELKKKDSRHSRL